MAFHPSSDWMRRLARSVITGESQFPRGIRCVVALVVVFILLSSSSVPRARGRRYLPRPKSADVPRPAILIQPYVDNGVPPCLALACLVSRLVRFVVLKRHRSVSDWHCVGRLHQKQLFEKDVFLSVFARWAVDLPFLRDPGCSTLSVLEHSFAHQAPTRRPTSRNSTATYPPTHHPLDRHQSIAAPERRFQFIRPYRALSRLGSFCLPPPTCQRVLQLLVPRYMTACLTSSNKACRPLERVTSTWDSWLFAA